MLSKAVFKRVVPFLLSFVAGLFIASFFVSLAVPDFSGFRRGERDRRNRSEDSEACAGRDRGMERVDLMFAGLGNHEQRPWSERRDAAVVSGPLGGREPCFVTAQEVPDRLVMRGLVGLEVEMQHHQWPGIPAVLFESLLHQRSNAIEEMRLERWLGAIRPGVM